MDGLFSRSGRARHTILTQVMSAYKDLGCYISKVTFRLHDSFLQPTRIYDKAPYEVTETGWGEFEIKITVTFLDDLEKPVSFSHHLQLHPSPNSDLSAKYVVLESYDEFVFHDPYIAA
jgi:YEATS domain-containing protein 4